MPLNRQILLASHPLGLPKESDFRLQETPMPRAGAGEVVVRTLYLSVDPSLRGRIAGTPSYPRPIPIGEVMNGPVVGCVVESNDPRVSRDDIVSGTLGWQDCSVASAKSLRKIDPLLAPITTALYVLGIPGLTAYFGLLDICRPQPGETVVVSAAAGAVGSLVGQIARIKRCRAVGIASGEEQVRYIIDDLGFDAAFNYEEASDYTAGLRELCPNGIDVYFDNVGGEITDAVMRLLNTRARVAVCGQSSQYHSVQPDVGPRWLGQLMLRQARVEGFLVQQFAERHDDGLRQLSTWLREKRLKYHEEIVEGLDNAPKALIGMLEGRNLGEPLVRVASMPAGQTVSDGTASLAGDRAE